MKNLLLLTVAAAAMSSLAHGAYTFGPQQRSVTTSSITFNATTGAFQYLGAATTTDDSAYLPLTGTGAALITPTSTWTATITPSLNAKSMVRTKGTPNATLSLGLIYTSGGVPYAVGLTLGQTNNSGSTDNTDIAPNFYGAYLEFQAFQFLTGVTQKTTPLGISKLYGNVSYQPVSGGIATLAATKAIDAVTGVISFSFNPTTHVITGLFNGVAAGSFTLPANATAFTMNVYGGSGEGIAVTAGGVTAGAFAVKQFHAQTITFPAIAAKTFGVAPFALTATASSGLAVAYTITTNPVTVAGSTVTLGGKVTVTANQAGNSAYAPAPPVSQSFTVK